MSLLPVTGFPSQAVVEAYLRPSVEDSEETFSWGALDLPALREYARSKFGWPVSKTDEILLPVSKRWNDRKVRTCSKQAVLQHIMLHVKYYDFNGEIFPFAS